jgi:RNA polymerase sigma factor (sigma-70 family)
MDDGKWLADRFEAHRARLRAVAIRMLGSPSDADDAVQEAWLRLSRTDDTAIDNLGGWLTTVVARVCLDALRSRAARREEPAGTRPPEPLHGTAPAVDHPEDDAVMADSVGLALLVVLDTMTPAERVAFVLHDVFSVPFEEIGPVIGRSSEAARQLASRGRRRVQGRPAVPGPDPLRQRTVVEAFLAAARAGDFDALVAVLDPDVALRADPAAVATGAEAEVFGAEAVASTFAGRAQAAQLALVDGAAGLVWARGGRPQVVFAFTVADGTIVAIELLADPERLARMELVFPVR